MNTLKHIFQKGSRTYFISSLFFPAKTRQEITQLYAFVRTADNFVDQRPQDRSGFERFEATYKKALLEKTNHEVIDAFVVLQKEKRFNQDWVNSFFASMRQDLVKKKYETLDETIDYMHGSAEVVGLMMAKILDLPKESLQAARTQGRAMQYINFIRDIKEDVEIFGRTYLPADHIVEAGLSGLSFQSAQKNPEGFRKLIRQEIQRYQEWQKEADDGFEYIPKRYRIAIRTAADMYAWTAQKIYENPFCVFEGSLKPTKIRILKSGFIQMTRS